MYIDIYVDVCIYTPICIYREREKERERDVYLYIYMYTYTYTYIHITSTWCVCLPSLRSDRVPVALTLSLDLPSLLAFGAGGHKRGGGYR